MASDCIRPPGHRAVRPAGRAQIRTAAITNQRIAIILLATKPVSPATIIRIAIRSDL